MNKEPKDKQQEKEVQTWNNAMMNYISYFSHDVKGYKFISVRNTRDKRYILLYQIEIHQ